jgi:DNA-binding CsgD family transcriptional regulator/tetratricopeptide (TPR) repeat protein
LELVEREQSLAELRGWLDAAVAQGGRVALIRGEAGIGKTSLLHEFCHGLRGVRVLWGACDALFTPRPLAPLYDIARQAQGALLSALSAEAHREQIFGAMLAELERPDATVVVFEDMHWADEATLDLLKFLGRRVRGTRALIAVTYRDDEVTSRHPLRSVIGDLPRATTCRMELAPLSEAAVAELARHAGRATDGLHRVTGGNPLFVTEVIATRSDVVPPTIRDAVLARAAKLSPAGRRVAELVCVIPGAVEPWLVDRTVGQDDAAVEECLAAGLVRGEGGELAFRHELARLALDDSLPPSRRQRLHAQVLAALEARGSVPVARLAHHADGAGSAEAVLRFAPAAATEAAALGAHREAASQYRLALRYAAVVPADDRASLLDRLAYECYLTSEHERAIEAQRAALDLWRAGGAALRQGAALTRLSRMSWYLGRREDADRYAHDSVTLLETLPAGPPLAAAYANRAQLSMEAHDIDAALAWARRAIDVATSLGADEILSDASNTLGTSRLIAGDAHGWVDLERSLQLALAGGFQVQVARAYLNMCAMAVSRRQYAEADRCLHAGLEYCERRDLDNWWLFLTAYRVRMRFERGEWNEASVDAETVLDHPRTAPMVRNIALRILGHLRIRRGDPGADAALGEARVHAEGSRELQRIGTLATAHAEAAWLAGDRDGVVRELGPLYERLRQHRDPRMKGEIAVLLWRVGALDERPSDIADPYALEIAGDWQGAAALWERLGCPYERAVVLGLHGGEAEQREALAGLERLGAAPAAQLVRGQMRARGVRRVPRGARGSTKAHPHGLTHRETEILGLMAEGLSNPAIGKRLFVSARTVDHHVSAILAKLGVPTRAGAIAWAHRTAGTAAPAGSGAAKPPRR